MNHRLRHPTMRDPLNQSNHSQAQSILFSCSLLPPRWRLIKGLFHGLVRQLDTEESGGVCRNSSGQGRAKAGEEGLDSATGKDTLDGAADGGPTFGRLQSRLDGVDGEDGDPHGNTRSTTSSHDCGQAQFSGGIAVGVLGAETALDILVDGKVGGGTRTITSQSHGTASKHRPNTTFLVELSDDIDTAIVLGLLAGGQLFLALDLEKNLDSLKGGCDEGHGDGGEEAGGTDLADGVLGGIVLDGDGGKVVDQSLAHVITPETDGKHGGDTDEWGRDTGVETTGEALTRDRLSDHVHGARVDTLFSRLQAHLDQIKGMADNDGAETSDTTGGQRPQT